MVIGECMRVFPDRMICTTEESSYGELDGLIQGPEWNDSCSGMDISDVTKLYSNVRYAKAYGRIVYGHEQVGVEASGEVTSALQSAGIPFHSRSVEGYQLLVLDDSVLAFMEDDDDGDPDTGFFHFVARV